jgi:large subunit ribosomal protein LP2
MKHIAAYVLLVLGGNATPSAEDVKNLITSAGGEADEEKLTALLGDLDGKNIHELLAEGEKKLKSVVGVASAGAAPAGKYFFSRNVFSFH